MNTIPFNEAKFKEIAGDCTVEHINYMPRGKNGMRSWEILARTPNGNCKIAVLCDYGYKVDGEVVEIMPFSDRDERNAEINRLYNEKHLSQVFLANLFHMSQPSVSMIIKLSRQK